jgi:hypothetical protein
MATFEEHCRETEEKMGERYEQVHKWLDELQPVLGPQHRSVRHNERGVQYVRKTWGERAAIAARIHIARDEDSHVIEDVGGAKLWIPKRKARLTNSIKEK